MRASALLRPNHAREKRTHARRPHSPLLALSAAAIGLLCSLAASADLIENVTVVSPEQARPSPNRHVLIRGERIAEISERPIAAPSATTRIDGRGRFLTPGLTDSHVHVSTPPGLPLGSEDKTIAALAELYARQQPRSYLYFGVTQVLDLAGFAEEGIAAFEAQPVHPELFHCGAVIVLDGYPMVMVDKSIRYQLLPNYCVRTRKRRTSLAHR